MHTVERATGRWAGILKHFGLDDKTLSGDHCPCPVCGGKDRFRFDDKEGRGTYFCSHCGAGAGMDLLMKATGMTFKEAATAVDGIIGSVPEDKKPSRQQSTENKVEVAKRIWSESVAVTVGDPVHQYLTRRTGENPTFDPGVIRYHPSLRYRKDDGSGSANHPGMIARVQALDGSGTAVWRTFLTADGRKADVSSPKKGVGSMPAGSAVRLSGHTGTLGIAEGIETALCASKRFGIPVWSATCLAVLEKWIPPEGVSKVWILGDNDTHSGGQIAAWRLSERLLKSGIEVVVRIPDSPGTDWADA